jgi:hypothetical protein
MNKEILKKLDGLKNKNEKIKWTPEEDEILIEAKKRGLHGRTIYDSGLIPNRKIAAIIGRMSKV